VVEVRSGAKLVRAIGVKWIVVFFLDLRRGSYSMSSSGLFQKNISRGGAHAL